MKFNILKPEGPTEGVGSIWDIFKLDSFTRDISLSKESIGVILDKFQGDLAASKLFLETLVIQELFTSMGGSEETPKEEIAAFMYVLLYTDNFRFQEILSLIITATFTDTTFNYFEEAGVVVPVQYVEAIKQTMQDSTMLRFVSSRHNFSINLASTVQESEKFTLELPEKLTEYYAKGKDVLEQIKNFITN